MVSATTKLAIISRLLVILIQFFGNALIPDHDAGVFQSPKSPANESVCNTIIDYGLSGFRRWDAEYFLHIAEYGYTYENTLAFYPLYPYTVRYSTDALEIVVPEWAQCSRANLLLAVGVLLNIFFFVMAANTLQKLSEVILLDRRKSFLAVTAFCFNPASVFFSAPYSESLYTWLSFVVMLMCATNQFWLASLPLVLSILCRSNGMINVGFLLYYSMRYVFSRPTVSVLAFLQQGRKVLFILVGLAITFAALQFYFYSLYCVKLDIQYPELIKNHAMQYKYVLAGGLRKDPEISPWCLQPFALSYSYIQSHYWNVGFFNYYEFKQIPNFLLATPILLLFLFNSIKYLINNPKILLNLGLSQNRDNAPGTSRHEKNLFVFMVHALFLSLFCIFYVHIQVSTRLLASSSPILYWSAITYFSVDNIKGPEQINFVRNLFRFNSNYELLLKLWFLGYFSIGTILFSNFLPWT